MSAIELIIEAASFCDTTLTEKQAKQVNELLSVDVSEIHGEEWGCSEFRGGVLFTVGGQDEVIVDGAGAVSRA